ncbi:MAG: O-acetylhomoserine aminocarboxypropyltransferase/cysteine synthase [Deltaproteobacteria bacterium]|nr:O-acetylhomoserine aminocarboxypropyltransferase/cysteine synthase [Deltaproteobacteria bacterium]MBW2118542.1 O-acetylhomoserine aminocarboxypropyltransferase/cysteine synthase [Deltaproteobacteria bacterium]MBW2345019.1 O-acetylhomoserine aminocarboxypropyltransferase/cysteine synthase [Deltaproteobacteria bacterium]
MSSKYRFDTLALHAGAEIDETNSRGVPLYRTSSYVFNNTEHAADLFALKEPGNIYTRMMNPTHDVLEKRMAALESGAAALALASGTAAIFYSVINICGHGDEVVSAGNLYGGTYTMFEAILPELGIKVRFANSPDADDLEKEINEHTRMLFTEVIGNPVLDVANIREISKIAHKHHIPLVVDSTFTTPYLFRPLEHGADIVIHSLTKWLGGHGTGIGGIVVDKGAFDWTDKKFRLFNEPDASYHGLRYAHDLGELNDLAFITRMRLVPLRNLGACISPDNAWMFLQGIETLALRMQRHCDNAMKVAQYLKDHSSIEWVRYPGLKEDPAYEMASQQFENGFGGMVVFGIKGGRESGEKFINNLRLISHLANVGDAKSLAIHPASTTHSQLSGEQQREGGITPDLIRLSVGIESVEDIYEDLGHALDSIE